MRKWSFIGGAIAIDFVNTIGGRNEKNIENYSIRGDKLNNFDDLVEWSVEIKLISPAAGKKIKEWVTKNPGEAKKKFKRVKVLRESLYRILRHSMEKSKPHVADMQVLNIEYSAVKKNQKIVYSSSAFVWEFSLEANHPDIIINQVALSAVNLLVSGKLLHLKQCKGEDCGWLFLDTSKNQRRVWCDMKECGNLAKVRRFRRKL
jgi:predicted RNA-binding Zn ribbon-like protein